MARRGNFSHPVKLRNIEMTCPVVFHQQLKTQEGL